MHGLGQAGKNFELVIFYMITFGAMVGSLGFIHVSSSCGFTCSFHLNVAFLADSHKLATIPGKISVLYHKTSNLQKF